MIPAEAVEAALTALLPDSDLESLRGGFWWGNVETILEAAAPYMIQTAKAEAWEEGREYGIDECAGDVTGGINPYRKAAL